MMRARMISGLALAAMACIATFLVVAYIDDTEMPELKEEVALSKKNRGYLLGMGKTDTLHNLINLKAYCIGAWDSARIALKRAKHDKYGALIEFLVLYGQEGSGIDQGGRKAKIGGNIVSEYAKILGQLRAKYSSGVSQYILNQFHEHIVHGNGGLFLKSNIRTMFGDKGGQLVALRYQAFGFTDRPALLAELALKLPRYLLYKGHISKGFKDADAYAAAALLQSKYSGHYTSFYQRELAKVQRRMQQQFDVVAKAAYGAEVESFEAAYRANRKAYFRHIEVQAPAGVTGAKKKAAEQAWRPPTLKAIKRRAKKAAAAWFKKYQAALKTGGVEKLVDDIADETSGVKLYITTGLRFNAQSTMRPKITFVGQKGSLTGRLRAVGARGVTTVQHFPTPTALGKITEVILDNTDSKKKGQAWFCSRLKFRIGGKNTKMITMRGPSLVGFTLKHNKVTLKPNVAIMKKVRYVKPGCVKFVATSGCKWSGSRQRSSDLTCTEEVDGNRSGFCKCDQGPMMKVNCGHDSFTCDEMCRQ